MSDKKSISKEIDVMFANSPNTKVALENCADANFKNKYLYSENLHLFKDTPLIKNNKDELSKIRKESRSLEKEILNYANKNLKDSMFFSDVYSCTLKRGG